LYSWHKSHPTCAVACLTAEPLFGSHIDPWDPFWPCAVRGFEFLDLKAAASSQLKAAVAYRERVARENAAVAN